MRCPPVGNALCRTGTTIAQIGDFGRAERRALKDDVRKEPADLPLGLDDAECKRINAARCSTSISHKVDRQKFVLDTHDDWSVAADNRRKCVMNEAVSSQITSISEVVADVVVLDISVLISR